MYNLRTFDILRSIQLVYSKSFHLVTKFEPNKTDIEYDELLFVIDRNGSFLRAIEYRMTCAHWQAVRYMRAHMRNLVKTANLMYHGRSQGRGPGCQGPLPFG